MTDKLTKAKQYLTPGACIPIDLETTTLLVDALRQALAEPEQTPVAYMGTDAEGNPNKFRLGSFGSSIALYTKEQL